MGRNDNMALKVDIVKAFDMISWNFLIQVLRRMDFLDHFLNLITDILQSARLSILINDTPHGYFSYSREVYQGDPLPPLLFCIAEEALIRWIEFSLETSHLTAHHRLPMQLLYADNILIVLEATRANARHIKWLLIDYGKVTSQIFSPSKSQIFYRTRLVIISRDTLETVHLLQLVLSPSPI